MGTEVYGGISMARGICNKTNQRKIIIPVVDIVDKKVIDHFGRRKVYPFFLEGNLVTSKIVIRNSLYRLLNKIKSYKPPDWQA